MLPKKMAARNSDSSNLAHAVIDGLRSRVYLVSRLLFAALCALFLNACEGSSSASESNIDSRDTKEEIDVLSITIEIEPRGGTILLSAELKNSGDQDIVFLPWGTPFEGAITANFLRLREVGSFEDVPYIGIMFKRRPPSTEDYKTLKPGASIKRVVDISKSYVFCANREYEIAYSGTLVSPNGDAYSIQSNTITVFAPDNFTPCL